MKAIVINPKDNVASALSKIAKGERVKVGQREVEVKQDIPFGHKFAIERIEEGKKVIKYGEAIGRATEDIEVGEHVHVHNVESLRAKGDLSERPRG